MNFAYSNRSKKVHILDTRGNDGIVWSWCGWQAHNWHSIESYELHQYSQPCKICFDYWVYLQQKTTHLSSQIEIKQ